MFIFIVVICLFLFCSLNRLVCRALYACADLNAQKKKKTKNVGNSCFDVHLDFAERF